MRRKYVCKRTKTVDQAQDQRHCIQNQNYPTARKSAGFEDRFNIGKIAMQNSYHNDIDVCYTGFLTVLCDCCVISNYIKKLYLHHVLHRDLYALCKDKYIIYFQYTWLLLYSFFNKVIVGLCFRRLFILRAYNLMPDWISIKIEKVYLSTCNKCTK